MSDRKIFYDKQQYILSIIGIILAFFFVSGCLGADKYNNYLSNENKFNLEKIKYQVKIDSINLEKTKIIHQKKIEVKCE